MAWENEKNIYIEKLEKIIGGISKILEQKGNRFVTLETERQLNKLWKQAKVLLNKLKTGEFEIAVVGLEKAGKSSFSNALIGFEALPTKDERCTYTSTCIRHGSNNSAVVRYYSKEDFKRDFSEKLDKIGIPNAFSYTIDTLSLDNYRQQYENCSEEKKLLYGESLNKDIENALINKETLMKYIGAEERVFNENEIETLEFKRFIIQAAYAIAVKEVIIDSTKLKEMPHAIMYDIPGFNSPTAMHEEQTLQKMDTADAIIMVAKADEPSITSDVLKIFKKADTDGELLSKKLFIFANKADRASDLQHNIEVTYDEWINKYHILPETKNTYERFVFGSANGYLAKLNPDFPEGEKIIKSLKDRNINDGIEEFRKKLTYYYNNERFDVLKKRVNKIWRDLSDLFKDVNIDLSNEKAIGYNESFTEIVMDLSREFKKECKALLEGVKEKTKHEINTEHPLKNSITEHIGKLITIENYTVSQEEIDKYHIENVGIGNAEQPDKVCVQIRNERFKRMYDDFEKEILDCTELKHTDIVDFIMDGMISKTNAVKDTKEYDELKTEFRNFFHMEDNIGTEYYRGLVERFSRDLFEVQIMYTPGISRLNKFEEEMSNFLSLGVFFSKAENEDNTAKYMNNSLSESMLCKILLYPETAEMTPKSEIIEHFKKITGLQEIVPSIEKMIDRLISENGRNALNVLNESFMGYAKKLASLNSEAAVISTVKDIFEGILTNDHGSTAFLTELLENKERYSAEMTAKNYEDVRRVFDQDITALRIVLEKAFVPAIDIEKAFLAHETKAVEDMIKLLDTKEFDKFIRQNASKMCPNKMSEIEKATAQRALDNAAANEICKILNQIAEVTA